MNPSLQQPLRIELVTLAWFATGCAAPAPARVDEPPAPTTQIASIPCRELFEPGRVLLHAHGLERVDHLTPSLLVSSDHVVVTCAACDPVRASRYASSRRLPLDRAMSVAQRLEANGIAPERIEVVYRRTDDANPSVIEITLRAQP